MNVLTRKLIAVKCSLIEHLKERRFLKFRFSNHKASSLLLRKHPEPVVATAIMVVDKF